MEQKLSTTPLPTVDKHPNVLLTAHTNKTHGWFLARLVHLTAAAFLMQPELVFVDIHMSPTRPGRFSHKTS